MTLAAIPFWAELILCSLLPPERVDDVTGDLIELSREEPRTSAGWRRHAWWARQAGGQFLRSYGLFPLALVVMMISNDLFNTFRDSAGNNRGSNLFGPVLFTVFACAALLGGWRTRRISGGVVASTGSHLMAWTGIACWWTLTTYPFAFSQQRNPYWIRAWHWSAAPGESFMHWIIWDNVGAALLGGSVLLLLSLLLGLIGGAIGSQTSRRFRATSS
jgi:hypothetical protein